MLNLKKFICWFCICGDITGAIDMEPVCPKLDNEYRMIETMLRTEGNVENMKKEMTEIQRDVSERLKHFEEKLDRKFVDLEMKQNQEFADLKTGQNQKFADLETEQIQKFADLETEQNQKFADLKSEQNEIIQEIKTRIDSSDCADILKFGFKNNGIYTIRLNSTNETIQVYCDLETDGGGWTVFQYRSDGSVNFYRDFADYKNGFGDFDGEFWLGLKYIFELTRRNNTELRIDLTNSKNTTGYEKFDHFQLSNSKSQYILSVSGSSGNISPEYKGFSYHSGMKFSTFDYENRNNCAKKDRGGWWYGDCAYANLNGHYAVPGNEEGYNGRKEAGMTYRSFDGTASLKTSKMMLRRKTKSFSVKNEN